MSIYITDVAGKRSKIAGVGLPGPAGKDGKSPYQVAVEGGYTGTETEFNLQLASVGGVFWINLTKQNDGTWSSDKTFDEIYEAYQNGKSLLVLINETRFSFLRVASLYAVTSSVICFMTLSSAEYFFAINKDETITFQSYELYTIGVPLNMKGKGIVNLPDPSTATSAANKNYVDSKSPKTYVATIGTTWTEDSDTGVKSQLVSIAEVVSDNTAKVDHVYNGNGSADSYDEFVEAENQYLNYITNGYAETVAGGIKFYIFGDAPSVEIPIIVEVN